MLEEREDAFARLGVSEPVLRALKDLGYEEPTPIQERAIPLLASGKDVLGQAQTGTGKTAAFALPLLGRIDLSRAETQVLVLAPTRELALQVAEAFETFAAHMKGLRTAAIFGGQAYGPQFRALNAGAHVVVGTPGRIIDHLERGSLRLGTLQAVVLDEADEMLRMGFVDDVVTILAGAPEGRQSALFSATMPPQIRNLARRFMRDPEEVVVQPPRGEERTIRQRVCVCHHDQKIEVLARFLEVEDVDAAIIFTRTKAATLDVSEQLTARGLNCAALNGDLAQELRERTVNRVRSGELDILVATDVAARGLDLDRITHVFNFDLPGDAESYVHRVGRTGRAGRAGEAILLVTPRERMSVQRLERATRAPIEFVVPPSGTDIRTRRIARLEARLDEQLSEGGLDNALDVVTRYVASRDADPMQVAAALLRMQGDLVLEAAELPDLSSPQQRRRTHDHAEGGPEITRRRTGFGQITYRLDVGSEHGAHPRLLVDSVARATGMDPRRVGDIRIQGDHTFIDLPPGMPHHIFERLSKTRVCRRPLNLEQVAAAG